MEIMNLSRKNEKERVQYLKNAELKEIEEYDNVFRYVKNDKSPLFLAC